MIWNNLHLFKCKTICWNLRLWIFHLVLRNTSCSTQFKSSSFFKIASNLFKDLTSFKIYVLTICIFLWIEHLIFKFFVDQNFDGIIGQSSMFFLIYYMMFFRLISMKILFTYTKFFLLLFPILLRIKFCRNDFLIFDIYWFKNEHVFIWS